MGYVKFYLVGKDFASFIQLALLFPFVLYFLLPFVLSFSGYLILHIVQCLFGILFMYSFVLPIKHGEGIEMVKSLGTGM